jgi:prevent-host-death family protein
MVMRVLPLTEVKAKLSEVIDEIVETQERVTVTRNGRPVAVLVGCDDLEAIEETLEILSDPALVKEVEAGRRAISAGDVVDADELRALRERLRSATDDPA